MFFQNYEFMVKVIYGGMIIFLNSNYWSNYYDVYEKRNYYFKDFLNDYRILKYLEFDIYYFEC